MYEGPERILRDLARKEPLLKRAQRMTEIPSEISLKDFDKMDASCRNFLSAEPPATPLYLLVGDSYRLDVPVSSLSEQQRYRILQCLNAPNGIRHVRVVSIDNDDDTAVLDVHFYNCNYLQEFIAYYQAVNGRAKGIFPISGGNRILAGMAIGQVQVDSTGEPVDGAITMPDPAYPLLRLNVRPVGDYSTYTLSLSTTGISGAVIDPLFAEIRFKFRPGCFNNNCAPEWEAALPPFEEPMIDYLAKDYNSFRQTMIAAMSTRVPGWQPTSEADLDMVLAELFSVAADELSDYQDRVMNEAYFSTARKRVSTARHARLMDYHIHQGSQASTWVALEIAHEVGEKFFELEQGIRVWAGPSDDDVKDKVPENSVEFISRYEAEDKKTQTVHQHLNSIGLYTWGDTITSLAAGSTRADLKLYNDLYLWGPAEPTPVMTQAATEEIRDLIRTERISYLVIQEHLNPKTGKKAGHNQQKRQLLKLIPDGAEALVDPITDEWFVRVRWEKVDALRHAYCFVVECPDDNPGTERGKVENISRFHGNLVEVFHGIEQTTIFRDEGKELEIDPDKPLELHYRRNSYGEATRWGVICELPEIPLAYRQTSSGGDIPPVSTLRITVKNVGGGTDEWDEVPNFIHSDSSSENGDHFVVETDENRRSIVRFGNGKNGRELPDGAVVTCTYQYGLPLDGNVGADRLINFVPGSIKVVSGTSPLKLRSCWNPFDVTNGIDREPVAEIIRRVPEAYRQRQLRGVTLADYVKRAEEIPDVSRATARYAWTGSWRTVRITIDPVGTSELTDELKEKVLGNLNAVRLIGEDIEIRPPEYVPLEIKVALCAKPDIWPQDVHFVLEQEFSAGWTPDGRKGFFHPDEWTFGQPLYSSQIIGRLIRVEGVDHAVGQKVTSGGVEKTISVSIKRWDSPFAATDSLAQLNYNEIIKVMNNPDHMEQGFISFEVKGGRR